MKIRVENGIAYTQDFRGARRYHSWGVYVLAAAFRDHVERIERAISLSGRARMTQSRYDLLMQYVSGMEERKKDLQRLAPDGVNLSVVKVGHG